MTDPSTETPDTSTGAADAPKPVTADDVARIFAEQFDARIAPLTKKYNGEFADRRKDIEALRAMVGGDGKSKPGDGATGGETPKVVAQDPEKIAHQVYEFGKLEAQAEAKIAALNLADDDRESFESELAEIAKRPLNERADALRYLIRGLDLAGKRQAKEEPEKPGRDARVNGSQRGHAPAKRSPEPGLPITYREWMALPEKRQEELLQLPDFDPRTLPMR